MSLSVLRMPTRAQLILGTCASLAITSCGQPVVSPGDQASQRFAGIPGLSCVDDSDSDGAVDCEDDAPFDPHEISVAGAALTATHQEQVVRYSAGTSSWDSRLIFSVKKNDLPTDYDYAVAVFRPEALSASPGGRPSVQGNRITSARQVMDNPDTSVNRLHLSVGPHPDFTLNPYRSNAVGEQDPNGEFETYQLLMIGKSNRPGFPSASNDMPHLTLNRGQVVVRSPRTADATIEQALVLGQAEDIRTRSAGYVWGYEPSISMDGRLIIFSGRANERQDKTGATSYVFNATPNVASGWTEPRPISSMYWLHGPGAPSETRVDGIPFSELYPIAKQPLRDPTGRVYQAGQWLQGPYPWLSFDSSEIFIQSVRSFYGPTRSATTVVGARTNWVLRHLDGPINPTRARLSSDGRIDHWDFTPEGSALRACYELQTLGDDVTPLGKNGFHRITMTSLGLYGTAWDPMRDDGTRLLPMHPSREHVYGIMLSHSRRYVEVPLGQVPDGHYLIYLPMNEQLVYDHANIAREVDGVGATPGTNYGGLDIWGLRGTNVQYSAYRTPDVSGNLHNGQLRLGAAFPYEYEDAHGTWMQYWNRKRSNPSLPAEASAVSGDRVRGVWGNAIYFPSGSYVQAELGSSARERLRRSRSASVMFWVKPTSESDGRDFALLSLDGLIQMEVVGNEVAGRVSTGSTSEVRGPRPLPEAWTHVAMVRNGGTLHLFLNGEEVDRSSVSGGWETSGTLRVGPYDGGARDSMTMALMDEVSISDVARSQQEIDVAAFRQRSWIAPRTSPAVVPAQLEELPQYTPAHVPQTQPLADLGKKLFFDPMLSRDESVSCGTCHRPERWFADGQRVAVGIEGRAGTRNTPSIANRLFGAEHFVDGRARSLEEQVLEPIQNPLEMDLSLSTALDRLGADSAYRADFAELFGGVSREGLARALSAYVRTLVSAGSRFDSGHLTPAELRGQGVFFGKGRCSMCHNGPNLTDESFHNIGLEVALDSGRRGVTGRAIDDGAFRTPSLRNVTQTGPYFHDGSVPTLSDVVEFYNVGGDGVDGRDLLIQPLGLTEAEKADLTAFLRTLTGTTMARTTEGPAAEPAAPRATLAEATVTACGGTCLSILGVGMTANTEITIESLDGVLLGVYSAASGLPLDLEQDLWLDGYQGQWDRASIGLGVDEETALSTAGLILSSINDGILGERIYLSPEGEIQEIPVADDSVNPPHNTDAYDLVSSSVLRVDFEDGYTSWQGAGPVSSSGNSIGAGLVGDGVRIDQNASLSYGSQGVRNERGTVSLWVRTNWDGESSGSFHPTHGLISIQPRAWRDELRLSLWKRRILGIRTYRTEGGSTQTWTANTAVPDWQRDRWYHVAATWDAAQGRIALYWDGVLATETFGWEAPALDLDTAPVDVGTMGHAATLGLDGELDEVTLFDRALGDDEIAVLAAGPVQIPDEEPPLDPVGPPPLWDEASLICLFEGQSLRSETGETPVSQQSVSFTDGIEGGGANIDGNITYPGDVASLTEGSVALWVRTNWSGKAGGENPSHSLFSLQPTPWRDDLWIKVWKERTLAIRSYRRGNTATSTTWAVNIPISQWEADRWYHVAATWSQTAGELSLYWDGELAGVTSNWQPPVDVSPADIVIGNNHTGIESLDGSIDELLVFDRALSADEIEQLVDGQ